MQSLIISKGTAGLREEKLSSIIEGNFEARVFGLEDGKVNISIDAVRALINFVNIKPSLASVKIAAVKDAHLLSLEAQNALLKILEEPPEYAQIILLCSHESSLLDTVVSRCKLIDLGSKVSIDVDSDEFAKAESDLKLLIGADLKARLDWLAEKGSFGKGKKTLSDRKSVLELLDMWEVCLRDFMLADLSKEWADQIKNLDIVRTGIAKHNANPVLSLENFIINLPK